MTHKKQAPSNLDDLDALDAGGSSRSVCTIRKVQCDFTEKEFFTVAARAALIGCELTRAQLGHAVIYRLECLDGALMLSHQHDVQAAIASRGGSHD
jgi:hypothetical protein